MKQKIQTLKIIGTISGLIEIHLSWKSMIENYRQNDDAYIGNAIMLSGFLLNTFAAGEIAPFLGLASTTPVTAVLAIVIFIGVLVFTLLKDTHFEKWLANGPFALGNGKCDYWNNGRYIEWKYPRGTTICQYGGFDQDDASQLVIDDEGNLVDAVKLSSISGRDRNIFRKENNKVYLKAGGHPLAKDDTLTGVIGRPYTPIPMMQPQVEERFMGHTPGADPMTHVPASKPGLFFKSTPNPDR